MQKPKVKIEIVIFLEFWVVFKVLSFVGNSVYNIAVCILNRYINSGLQSECTELRKTVLEFRGTALGGIMRKYKACNCACAAEILILTKRNYIHTSV